MEDSAIPPAVLTRLREVCLALPEAHEEPAWVGTRWRVRKRTFAHVVAVEEGSSSVFARVSAADGPATVVTFRSTGEEMRALRDAGPPFFYAGWGRDVLGMFLDGDTDWTEVGELLTESYCVLAPKKLRALVDRPHLPGDD
ncbi:MmcQ/YjbR family DNA-binding protein [Yinghuangia sp. ASG 101]|uniref:MmcQ/YjbR family DNA-binding protein n=1 Tax=Yinghuangia sp. ASG 101 TaxID=2896848 RepID=UPI001E5085C2|nr:MmcQ/YjbR family DNA-binding protein [Yinghuangia sp. ASG 101]UGQ12868.1 MmcQ/YjbR family DNA-binding protein [Yinghuangia sp. ASG 101]